MIKIEHTIKFEFSSEIFPQPHTIRLTPRRDFYQKIISSETRVSPQPVGLKGILGFEGNLVHTAWFGEKTRFLLFRGISEISLHTFNPLDFLIHPDEAGTLPVKYASGYQLLTHHYLNHSISNDVKSYAEDLMTRSGNHTVSFLVDLAIKIHSDFEYVNSDSLNSPETTFHGKSGNSTELTLLFIEITRFVGIASRFVSGYYIPPDTAEKPDLHSWAEVYIPGAGWKGFDPTHGIAVYGRHIALASGISHDMATPVSGHISGDTLVKKTSTVSILETEPDSV